MGKIFSVFSNDKEGTTASDQELSDEEDDEELGGMSMEDYTLG